MEDLRQFFQKCLTADRTQQKESLRKYAESIIEPQIINQLKVGTPHASTSNPYNRCFENLELDERVLKYIRKETVLTEQEARSCLNWSLEDDLIKRLNQALVLEEIKVTFLKEASFGSDDGMHFQICVYFDIPKKEIKHPEKPPKIYHGWINKISKRILKACSFAAFLGIPEITITKNFYETSDPKSIAATIEKLRELSGVPFEDFPEEIKIKVDPSKFDTETVGKSIDALKTAKKEFVFKLATKNREKIIDGLKSDIRTRFRYKQHLNSRFFTYNLFDDGILNLENETLPRLCPEIENANPGSVEFTVEEEEALNKALGLEGFKMRISRLAWLLEYPPDLVC